MWGLWRAGGAIQSSLVASPNPCPVEMLGRCWELVLSRADTPTIPISHFPRAHPCLQRKHFAVSGTVPFWGCCDTRMAQSCGTVPGTEWHWSRTLPAGTLQQHLTSLPSHPEMRFLLFSQLQGETPWTVQQSQHQKMPQNKFCSQAGPKELGQGTTNHLLNSSKDPTEEIHYQMCP